jgi:hypothetical protein
MKGKGEGFALMEIFIAFSPGWRYSYHLDYQPDERDTL